MISIIQIMELVLGFVTEPGGSSAKCAVPEHQRNKFFKWGYTTCLQRQVSMSGDCAARHWYRNWRRKSSPSCVQQCQSDWKRRCVSKLHLRIAWKLGLFVLITHLLVFIRIYSLLKSNIEYVILICLW